MEGLFALALVSAIGGGVAGAVSSYQQGKAQQQQAEAEAAQNEYQAKLEQSRSEIAQLQGEQEAAKRSRLMAADIGSAYANWAGNGLLADGKQKDTLASILSTTVQEGTADISTIRDNAAMNVWNLQANKASLLASAQNSRTAGRNARVAGNIGVASSLLGAGFQVGSAGMSYYGYKSRGGCVMGVIEIRSRGERLNNLGNVRNANLDTGADKVFSAVGRLGETISRGGTALGREGMHLFAAMEEREYQRKSNLAYASAAKWLRERFYGAPDDASGKHPAAIDDWMWGKDDAHPDALDRNPEEWASRQQRDYDHFETRLLTEEHEMSAKELERFKSSSRYQALLERYSALEADTVAKANRESERQGILGCYAETRNAAVAAVPGAEDDFLDALNSRLTFDKISDPALRQAQIRKEAEALAGDRLKLEIAAINAANLNATDPAEAEKAYQDLIKGIEDGSVRLLDEPLARAAYGEPSAPGAYGLRPDGTAKGSGFLGPQQLKDGKVATEYSVGVEIDGKEMEIPTLVPTLTAAERKEMLEDIIPNGKEPPKAIMDKAVAHAEKRLKAGKSVFAEPDEAENSPYSRFKSAAVSDLKTNLAHTKKQIEINRREAEKTAAQPFLDELAGLQANVLDPSQADKMIFDIKDFRSRLPDAITPETKADLLRTYSHLESYHAKYLENRREYEAALEADKAQYGYIDDNGVFQPASAFRKHPTEAAVRKFDFTRPSLWQDTSRMATEIEAWKIAGHMSASFYEKCRKFQRNISDEQGRAELAGLLPRLADLEKSGYGLKNDIRTAEMKDYRKKHSIPEAMWAKRNTTPGLAYRSAADFVKDLTTYDGDGPSGYEDSTEEFITPETWCRILDCAYDLRGQGVKNIWEAVQLIVAPSIEESIGKTLEERLTPDYIRSALNRYRIDNGVWGYKDSAGQYHPGDLDQSVTDAAIQNRTVTLKEEAEKEPAE